MTQAILKLDANEGRPCVSAEAIAALVGEETLRRYPDPRPLEAAIAARKGIPPERVLAVAGADDAIDRAIRSFGGAGATVLSTQPAFEEYAAAAVRGVKIRSWTGKPGRDGMIRITCPGDELEFGRLLEALGGIGRLK
jgi:histidinol-phosphate/aromatic aminotransferase/cobyric acid decarboxylase-like protein